MPKQRSINKTKQISKFNTIYNCPDVSRGKKKKTFAINDNIRTIVYTTLR